MRGPPSWVHGLPLLLALTFGSALGDTIPPVNQGTEVNCSQVLPSLGAPSELWERALETREYCHLDLGYLIGVARWLNGQRRYEAALLYAERALMLSADNVPAWIEFAISHAALGDTQLAVNALRQAKEFAVEQIGSHSGPDTNDSPELTRLTVWVTEINEMLESSNPLRARATVRVADFFAGYDDNLLGDPTSKYFELTLPSGAVLVPAPTNLNAKKGFFYGLSFTQKGEILSSYQVPYIVKATTSATLSGSAEGRTSIEARAEYSNLAVPGYYLASRTEAFFGGTKLTTLNLSGQFGSEIGGLADCSLRIGTEFELRRYPSAEVLDGNFVSLLQEGVCSSGLNWRVKVGSDLPRSPGRRAGGRQNNVTLDLSKTILFDEKKLLLSINLSKKIDSVGYSPLLSDGLRRHMDGWGFAIEYTHRQRSDLAPYVLIEHSARGSNIELFKTRKSVLQFGLRREW